MKKEKEKTRKKGDSAPKCDSHGDTIFILNVLCSIN